MSFSACIDEITRAAGRSLTDEELDDLLSELQRRIDQRRSLNLLEDMETAVLGAANSYAKDMVDAAKIQKRNAAINLKHRLDITDTVLNRFGDDPALGIEAALVGVNRAVSGARESAAAQQNMLERFYVQGFLSEMAPLWREFVSGAFDREIANVLWAINRAEPKPVNVPAQAVRMAEVIAKWQEVARTDANKAGAWIKKLEGYIVRQSHDQYRIARAGYDAWKAAILPRLDIAKTMPEGGNVDTFLKAVYQGLASGVHLKAVADRPSGLKGPRNIAKKASAERVLHFKGADDWFEYNLQFGTGNLREAVLRGLELAAQSTGLMRRLGTNPEANLARIVEDVTKRLPDPAQRKRLSEAVRGRLRNQLAELDGSTRVPVNQMGAQISATVRTVNRMTKLGGALLSQMGDIAFYGSELRYQGRGMLSGVADSIGSLFKGMGGEDRRQVASMLSVYSDFAVGDISNRFSIAEDGVPGAASTLQQLFFKWNGMSWWTDRQRKGIVFSMSHHLALNRGKGFAELSPDLSRVLSLYGIGDKEWNTIRAAATKEADGREYVVPDAIGDRATADKLRSYYIDRMGYAVIEPDQRTRALLQQGTQRGTPAGEFLRFIGEFKAFPVTALQKAWGREIYGRGSKSLGEALRNGHGEVLGIANLIVWSTVFGYLSMSAKDLAKGRTPRDPLDHKTWLAAMAQGGGAGIYGDFLFGEVRNRFGGGIVSTMAGPTAGNVEDLADLWGRLREGDDTAAAAFRLLLNNTPFLNMFYSRIALDYLFLWRVQEWLSPGAIRRMERRIEKENAQTFLVRPSQAVR